MHAGVAIENLAKKNDLNYYSIACKAKELSKYQGPNQQGQIEVPINNLAKILED